MRTSVLMAIALTGSILTGAGLALAAGQNDETHEAQAMAALPVSLPQAIATAEQQTGGKAYDAGVDLNGGAGRIVVETVGPKGVQTVMVDGSTGKIVGHHPGGEQD